MKLPLIYSSESTHHGFHLMQHWLFPHISRRSSAKPLLIRYSCLRWARYIICIRTGKQSALAWYVRNNSSSFMYQKYYFCSSDPHYVPDREVNKWECIIKTGCSVSSESWMWVCTDPDDALEWTPEHSSKIKKTASSLKFLQSLYQEYDVVVNVYLLNKERKCRYIGR